MRAISSIIFPACRSGTRGGAVFEHNFPSDGDYLLHIGNLIGGTHRPGQEHVNTVIAVLDGKKFFELEIGGGEDSVQLDQLRAAAVEKSTRDSRVFRSVPRRCPPGSV
jgi:hypothetical protein